MIILPSRKDYPAQRLAMIIAQSRLQVTANLVEWAKNELELAGLFDEDSDYEGALGPAILSMVEVFADQGHSGFSAGMSAGILNKLLNYEPLTPITNPMETGDYEDVSNLSGDGKPCYQCKRDSTIFSDDRGKSWYKLVEDYYDDEREFIDDDGNPYHPYYSECRQVDLDDYNAGKGHSVDYRKHND